MPGSLRQNWVYVEKRRLTCSRNWLRNRVRALEAFDYRPEDDKLAAFLIHRMSNRRRKAWAAKGYPRDLAKVRAMFNVELLEHVEADFTAYCWRIRSARIIASDALPGAENSLKRHLEIVP